MWKPLSQRDDKRLLLGRSGCVQNQRDVASQPSGPRASAEPSSGTSLARGLEIVRLLWGHDSSGCHGSPVSTFPKGPYRVRGAMSQRLCHRLSHSPHAVVSARCCALRPAVCALTSQSRAWHKGGAPGAFVEPTNRGGHPAGGGLGVSADLLGGVIRIVTYVR